MANILDDNDTWVHFMTVCNVSARARTCIIQEEGLDTLRDFATLSSTDLNTMVSNLNKVYRSHTTANRRFTIGILQNKRLLAILSWAKDALIEGQHVIPVPDAATLAAAYDNAWLADLIVEYDTNRNDDAIDTSATSTVITYNGNNWWDARRNIIDYLSTKIGSKGIPLSYLVRLQDGAWDDHYSSNTARRIACYRHSGPGYDADNVALYQILAQRFGSSTLSDLVRGFDSRKDGRAAWAAIRSTLEGTQWKRQLSLMAHTMLSNSHFSGTSNNFGLEDYYRIHVRCHLMLVEAGEELSEHRKIELFMLGITEASVKNDYKSQRNNPTLNSNFQNMYDHLNEGYRLENPKGVPSAYRGRQNKRRINQVEQSGRGGRGGNRDGGRGRGRYGNRDGGHGGGRGRDDGRGQGGRDGGRNQQGRYGGRHNYGRDYSLPAAVTANIFNLTDDQWYNLSREQKQAVRALRANQRQINSVRGQPDDNSVLTGTPTSIQIPSQNGGATTPPNGTANRISSDNSTIGQSSHAANSFGHRSGRGAGRG